MSDTQPAVGGTIQRGGFEIVSNTETPEQMAETLGVEAPPVEKKELKAKPIKAKPATDAEKAEAERKARADATGRLHGEDGKFAPKAKAKDDGEEKEKPVKGAAKETEEAPEKAAAAEEKPDEADETEEQAAKREAREVIEQRKSRAQERVARATREAAEARQRAAELQAENERLRRGDGRPEARDARQGQPAGKPRPEDFESVDQYLDARDAYNRKEWEREASAKQQIEQTQRRITEDLAKSAAAVKKAGGREFLESLDPEVAELEPTWVVAARGEKPTALNAIADFFVQAGDGAPRMMSYFSDHPDELTRLSTLTPWDFQREMGKIEARLEVATTGAPTNGREVSRAKPPVKPVTGAPTVAEGSEEDPGSMDFDKFRAWKAKQARR